MEKNLSKTLFHPSCQISNVLEIDQSTVELERKYMLPPITTQVSVSITPHGDFTSQTFMVLKTATQPQLPVPWLQFDLHSMIPNKSWKIVKRTLKEKHISKSKLAHMFEQTVEWIRTMSMDVVLPALVLCLREEESMVLEAKTRAEEWEKLNIDVPYNYNCAHCNRTGNGHISSVEASIIGKKSFARVMHFLHCKYLLNKSDGRFLEIPDQFSDSITSLNGCLKQELIHTFSKDLINCVYQELLNNEMGKTFPVNYLCLELLRQMFTVFCVKCSNTCALGILHGRA